MKIGIIGLGFVGSAIYNSVKDKSKVYVYDKFKDDLNTDEAFNEVTRTDILFLCLPTPKDEINGVNVEPLKEVLEKLSFDFGGVLVLKSTIHPDYLEQLPLIKSFNIVSNPEFLTAHKANDDFLEQSRILLGGRIDICHKVAECYRTEFNLRNIEFEYCSFDEALQFKYFRNIKLAYDVLFTNFIHRTSDDYRKINQLFRKFPVKNQAEIFVHVDGRPGFSGDCLPKDLYAHEFIRSDELTDFMIKYNIILQQGKKDE